MARSTDPIPKSKWYSPTRTKKVIDAWKKNPGAPVIPADYGSKLNESTGSRRMANIMPDKIRPISTAPATAITAPDFKSQGLDTNNGKYIAPMGKGIKTSTFEKMAPYASNIINSFRRPPTVKYPHLDDELSAKHVNMDNDRAMVERGIRGSNTAADNNLSENTAAAVKMSNMASRFTQLSAVNSTERNMNTSIDSDMQKTNAQIRAGNNMKLDGYDNANVERGIAIQNNASANVANASDKYIGIQNEQARNDLELKKYEIMQKADRRGLLGRNFDPTTGKPIQAKAIPGNVVQNPTRAISPVAGGHAGMVMAAGGIIKGFNSKKMYPVLSKHH